MYKDSNKNKKHSFPPKILKIQNTIFLGLTIIKEIEYDLKIYFKPTELVVLFF
jgi:hypothetical protein